MCRSAVSHILPAFMAYFGRNIIGLCGNVCTYRSMLMQWRRMGSVYGWNRAVKWKKSPRCEKSFLRAMASGSASASLLPSTMLSDDYLTTIARKSERAVLPSVFNAFREVQKFAANPAKSRKALKAQYFIRLRLKTPTVDIAPVKLYPYVKKQDANSNA
jgi:hypothetical protein